ISPHPGVRQGCCGYRSSAPTRGSLRLCRAPEGSTAGAGRAVGLRREGVLVKLIAAAPENVAARNVLALAAVWRGDFAEAERQYEGSLRYQPRQHRVLVALEIGRASCRERGGAGGGAGARKK